MSTRADRIFEIIEGNINKRMKVSEILKDLAKLEEIDLSDIQPAIVSATVRQDNLGNEQKGRTKRFNAFGSGTEMRGYVSIYEEKKFSTKKEILENYEVGVPRLIEEANNRVRQSIKEGLSKLGWRRFETTFLPEILDALGFHGIRVTQATRDGGQDAICEYQRGIVKSKTIVSAKHWGPNQTVPISEVQRLRGIRGDADTAIIITTAKFSADAIKEAEPSQNARSVVLIDGDTIADICIEKSIRLREIKTPKLFSFVGFDEQNEELETAAEI